MDREIITGLKAKLEARMAELAEADRATAEQRAPVALDQQSVGRLSRMDAMQIQAMANAQSRRRAAERRRISAALKRLEEGEFGYCVDCGEEIAARRLELDPATPQCVDCATGR